MLRWLLRAPTGGVVVSALREAEAVFTSHLTLVETQRVLRRHEHLGVLSASDAADARQLFAAVVEHWGIVEATTDIYARAGQAFPIEPVRTLDAIHLATALFTARFDPSFMLLSADDRVVANASRLGLRVVGR